MPRKTGKRSDYSGYRVSSFPVRHRKKVPFYPMLSLDLEIRAMMTEIHRLDTELGSYLLSGQDYYDLALDAYSSNTHWSTKIEGNRMTFEEVKKLATEFTNGTVKESPNGPNQEILNHLGFLFHDELGLPWNIETALYVHRYLMKGVSDIEPGVIRSESVSVQGSDGTEFFIACPVSSIDEELSSLMDWVNTSPFGYIVTATLFFHEFESIHPFLDGNGRTGRVLFQTLLKQLGLDNCDLCKFEEKMLSDSVTYYNLMSYTDLVGNYTPLVRYVTESLLEAYEEAVDTFSKKDVLRNMDENTRCIVSNARNFGPFTVRKASEWVHLSEAKVKKILDDLVDGDILMKEGRTRSMRYVFMDPFRDIKESVSKENPFNIKEEE